MDAIVPFVFDSAILRNWIGSKCQNYEPRLVHSTHRIDRLQSWASFAWMHDNAIHDLPNVLSKRIAVAIKQSASLSTE